MTAAMAERPLRVRALLFLYGNGNIAGCGLALLGPALLFAGVIERGWLPITLGLYAIGWLLAPRPPELARRIEDSLTIEQAIDRLLAPNGLLVLGAAEPPILKGAWISAASDSAFTLRRGSRSPEGLPDSLAAGQSYRATSPVRAAHVAAIPAAPAGGDASSPIAQEAVDAEPPTVADLLLEAGILANAGRRAEALALCQRRQQEVGPDSRVFFLMGMLHRSTGDLERAEACLHKTLYLDPDHDEALLSLAIIAAERGDTRMAENYRQSAARVLARRGSS